MTDTMQMNGGTLADVATAPAELEIIGLEASVEDKPILKGIDLVVRQGETHAMMGPNGSGKSTLANVLMGRPGYVITAGEVRSAPKPWPTASRV